MLSWAAQLPFSPGQLSRKGDIAVYPWHRQEDGCRAMPGKKDLDRVSAAFTTLNRGINRGIKTR